MNEADRSADSREKEREKPRLFEEPKEAVKHYIRTIYKHYQKGYDRYTALHEHLWQWITLSIMILGLFPSVVLGIQRVFGPEGTGYELLKTIPPLIASLLASGQAVFGTTGLIFEGATADAFEGLLTLAADPAADLTWNLPAAGGTLALTSDLASAGAAGELQRLARRTPNRGRMPCGQFSDPAHVITVVMRHEDGTDLEPLPFELRFDRPGVPRIDYRHCRRIAR